MSETEEGRFSEMSDDVYAYAKGQPDGVILAGFDHVLSRVVVDDDGTAWLPESDWAPAEIICNEIALRTEEPATVRDMVVRRLALVTTTLLAAIRYGSEHLESWTREWVIARGELLLDDVNATVAAASALEP